MREVCDIIKKIVPRKLTGNSGRLCGCHHPVVKSLKRIHNFRLSRETMNKLKRVKYIALVLMACLLLMSMAGVGMAQRRHRHNPQAGKRKAAKRIGIGTGIGVVAGAALGGKKGALIGGGIGAAGGTAYHVHKKNQWNRRHRRY
jgi:hypothetical protein